MSCSQNAELLKSGAALHRAGKLQISRYTTSVCALRWELFNDLFYSYATV